MENLVVIITGASSGIGAATARRLAKEGCRITLVARRLEQLDEVAADVIRLGGEALVIQTDLTKQADIERMVKSTIERWGQIDVLINNAGISFHKRFEDMSLEEIERGVRVNLTAVMQCARAVLPHMMEQKNGHIVNVASIAGLVATPNGGVYPGTKFGVVGFSDALRRELLKSGIKVSAFCPGFTPSEISPSLKAHYNGNANALKFPGLMRLEYVADQVAWLIDHPRRIFVIPKSWRILVELAYHLPWLADMLIPFFMKRKSRKGKEAAPN
jgi:short-subunit dehydrogenase